jgi:hypothetical protein
MTVGMSGFYQYCCTTGVDGRLETKVEEWNYDDGDRGIMDDRKVWETRQRGLLTRTWTLMRCHRQVSDVIAKSILIPIVGTRNPGTTAQLHGVWRNNSLNLQG